MPLDTPGTPKLADDGLCSNTGCSIRETDQCPVFRLVRNLTIPKVNNVIYFPKPLKEKSGFKITKTQMEGINDPKIIKLEEEKVWREMLRILEVDEKGKQGKTGWEIASL